MKPGISILGTGRMGSALARAFLEQGYSTQVWNRTGSKAEPLAALGARVAPPVQEAVVAGEIVVVNLTTTSRPIACFNRTAWRRDCGASCSCS